MQRPLKSATAIPLTSPQYRGQEVSANVFLVEYFGNPSGYGRPRQKVCVCVLLRPCDGEKLFEPWAFGRKGLRDIRTENCMFMLIFFADYRQLTADLQTINRT